MSSTNVVKESSPAVRRARRRHRRRTGGQNALLGPSNDGNLPKIKENSWSTDDAGESHDADTSGEGVPVTGSSDKIIAINRFASLIDLQIPESSSSTPLPIDASSKPEFAASPETAHPIPAPRTMQQPTLAPAPTVFTFACSRPSNAGPTRHTPETITNGVTKSDSPTPPQDIPCKAKLPSPSATAMVVGKPPLSKPFLESALKPTSDSRTLQRDTLPPNPVEAIFPDSVDLKDQVFFPSSSPSKQAVAPLPSINQEPVFKAGWPGHPILEPIAPATKDRRSRFFPFTGKDNLPTSTSSLQRNLSLETEASCVKIDLPKGKQRRPPALDLFGNLRSLDLVIVKASAEPEPKPKPEHRSKCPKPEKIELHTPGAHTRTMSREGPAPSELGSEPQTPIFPPTMDLPTVRCGRGQSSAGQGADLQNQKNPPASKPQRRRKSPKVMGDDMSRLRIRTGGFEEFPCDREEVLSGESGSGSCSGSCSGSGSRKAERGGFKKCHDGETGSCLGKRSGTGTETDSCSDWEGREDDFWA
ncbi:hypothetical protein MMC09_003294 [Bachmanniomyces sp. S44760]|nr:hypothetical protein [Bachmanniomyces sp. S44760]